MDFDFTKILLILVLVSGVLWVLDHFWLKKKRDPEAPSPVYVDWGASFFPILALVFVLRAFLFEPFQIPSRSMVPTLEVGDFIIVSKFSYGVRLPVVGTKIIPISDPQRGDVAVFIPPHDSRYFIKRVVGLPGDRVRVENNQVWINGEEQQQDFVATIEQFGSSSLILSEEKTGEVVHEIHTMDPPSRLGRNAEYVVPDGHYFMMGDNRDNSLDSRAWGPVPDSNMVGRAKAIWMHWENWGIPSFSRVGSIQ
ncbi:UNVERIFIED_CONTAM: hypothetical protein GTU68_053836 [Idotea baltica]|nr:hypothetical protein [Idotea baltica]